MEARLGLARLGAFRLGDYRPYVLMTIDGVARRLRIDNLSIRDTLGGNPNTATVRVMGFEPDEGEAIRIGLGSLDANHLLFAGHILKKTRIYEADNVANVAYDLSCISHEWRLNRRKVNARFVGQSATAIAVQLMADYAPDFTTDGVEADLPVIEEFTLTNEDLTDALDRLIDRIGAAAWGSSEAKDIYIRLDTSESATPINDTTHRASRVVWDRDLSPVRTRVTVEGAGVTATAPATAGDTALAVDDLLWYDEAGGMVTSGPQRITYTGVVAGGAGALLGTTVTPTNGPGVARRAATGLTAGDYTWVVTFVTAAGETLPSPASAVLTLGGAVEPPVSAPSATKQLGGSLSAGAYKWKYAYLTASGETLASSESASVTMDDVSPPSTIGTAILASAPGGDLVSGAFSWKYTFTDGSVETTPSPASNTITADASHHSANLTRAGFQAAPAGFDRQAYRTKVNGSTYFRMVGPSDGFSSDDGSYYYDAYGNLDTDLGAAAPSASTATYRSASVNVIASTNPLVTGIRVYRPVANGSTFKKVADIANTTGTYIDTTADGSLGSTELGAATALYLAANLTSIPIGPSGTAERNVYRTPHDGSTYGLQSNIPNNTTTTLTDTTADGSLGAAPPVTDTSGLVAITGGDVAAGAPSIPVTSTAAFRAAGGWAFIGSMPIRYSGFSGTELTGLPALGVDGSLGTTVKYGAEIVAAPLLVGIPASGDGAILYDIATGDEVNLLVTEDDLAAQDALTELLTASGEDPADGVIEEYIQDRRLSSTESRNRAQAHLALVKDPLVTVHYETFDRFTRSGRDVSWNSALVDLVGTFKIQSVTMTNFDGAQRQFPRRQVMASSRRFSFEAMLRLIRAA